MNASENMTHRAGRYLVQPTGYRAFVPAPLPPSSPPLDLDGTLRERLSGELRVKDAERFLKEREL